MDTTQPGRQTEIEEYRHKMAGNPCAVTPIFDNHFHVTMDDKYRYYKNIF